MTPKFDGRTPPHSSKAAPPLQSDAIECRTRDLQALSIATQVPTSDANTVTQRSPQAGTQTSDCIQPPYRQPSPRPHSRHSPCFSVILSAAKNPKPPLRRRTPPKRASCTLHPVFMKPSCYIHYMPNLQVRNIPDDLHKRLRRLAQENNSSMSAIVLSAVERELKRREWQERWAQRSTTVLSADAATLIAEARAEREAELYGPESQ